MGELWNTMAIFITMILRGRESWVKNHLKMGQNGPGNHDVGGSIVMDSHGGTPNGWFLLGQILLKWDDLGVTPF